VTAEVIEFSPASDAQAFAQVPAAPAVFALHGEAGAEPYVSRTTNLRRRLIRLLGSGDSGITRRLNLRERVGRIEYRPVASDFESQFVLYSTLRRLFPRTYRDRLRLRPAPLIKFNLDNPYARAYVTTRIGRLNGKSLYFGPFASRVAAEKYLNDSLDLFKIRRCVDDLHPDPKFPGCIYSEMKMCLAPCFRGCTDEQYTDEVVRVRRYLDSAGDSLRRELEQERDRASAELQFESAAALHTRIAKVNDAAGQAPEIARRLDELNGLMVQPSTVAGAVAFFRIECGATSERFDFAVSASAAQYASGDAAARQKHSMEARIAEALAAAPAIPRLTSAELMEHIALLKRWWFRTHKSGELFLAESGELPMRRIVRGVGRIFAGAATENQPSPTSSKQNTC
jgi:excinuclease ABC subunit C